MPTLKNTKWEAFCQHQATGKAKGSDSIRYAGYVVKKNAHIAQKASKLLARPIIQERIAELRVKIEADLRVEQVNVIATLNRIAASSMTDFVDFEKNRITFKSLKAVPKGLRDLIEEICVMPTAHGNKITIKLCSKMQALTLLGKNQQLFKEQVVLENPDGSNLVPPVIEVKFTSPALKKAAKKK